MGGEENTLEELAEPEDAKEIVGINRRTWLQTFPNEELGITPKIIEERFANIDERVRKMEELIYSGQNDSNQVWVSRDKRTGEVLGYLVFIRKSEEGYVRLRSIHVSPKYQGKGIGRRLVERCFSCARDGEPVRVEVTEHNRGAINFYKRLGFEDTGERVAAPVHNGITMTDCVFERVTRHLKES